MKGDVIRAVQDFSCHKILYVAVNCSLVTLIPKTKEAKTVKDLRPIACCTTLYKIISKIITSRLSRVVGVIIDESESKFVPGRNIQDNILIARELIRCYNRKHLSPRCTIQMDVKKAYDTVEWIALKHIMQDLNFLGEFID